MNTLELTKPNGKKVSQNACTLSAEINDSANEMTLDDSSVFEQNDYVSIEDECVKITDAPNGARSITRAQVDHNGNSTDADSHGAGCYVRDRAGTEILSKTFDGSTYWAGVYVNGERAFWTALEIDGDIGPVKMCSSEIPYLEFPFPRYIPAGATWKILIFTTETRQFHAGFYN